MGVRKSKAIGQVVNGYLVLDSVHVGSGTKYKTKCMKCGAIDFYFGITKNHPKCRACEGGRVDRGGKGHRGEQLYERYWCMMRRCGHKKGYENVSVCDEWARNYETFRDWALLNGYREDLTIDRIDYTKGYSPENCRWVDHRTQANNRRSNVFIEYGGKRMTAAQWEVDKGFPRCVISCRLKRGWSVEDAIMTPYKSRVKYSEMRKRETAGRA